MRAWTEGALTKMQCEELQEWARANKQRLISDAAEGNVEAKAVISLHRMLVRHADWPTWALFAGAVVDYIKERG